MPNNATNTQVTWASGNTAVATVDTNGLVTAVSPGIAIITATTVDGSFTDTASIEVLEPLTPPDCIQGTNLSLSATVVSFSDEQVGNPASNVIDGDSNTRWSAMNFPQNMVFDLGSALNVTEVNLYPYLSRDYQYLIEGSETSPTSGFVTLVDRQTNTLQSTVINDAFGLEVVRYIRLTVTGAATYTGPWVSISDLEVICAGQTLSVDENRLDNAIKMLPNPLNDVLTINIPFNDIANISKIKLVNTLGSVILETENISTTTSFKFNTSLSNGLYFIQVLDRNQQVLATRKVLKN